ncbi:hypothetical protein NMY22_g559 [Coprinellus aureogranulatus]|nr:hypothetical protein NMY22_g559 [Coprinellus aureogranulatus]
MIQGSSCHFRPHQGRRLHSSHVPPSPPDVMAPSRDPSEVKVLVVCLGNICRSPMGEAVLQHIAKQRSLDITVDSAGTAGYHVGEEPDERCASLQILLIATGSQRMLQRTVATCKKHGVPIDSYARQVATSDFTCFTHILASDENNLKNLQTIKPSNATAEVRLWGSYLDGKPIPDPYYGRANAFESVYQQCVRLSNAFLDEVFGSKDS